MGLFDNLMSRMAVSYRAKVGKELASRGERSRAAPYIRGPAMLLPLLRVLMTADAQGSFTRTS